jgi:hypothetical protein
LKLSSSPFQPPPVLHGLTHMADFHLRSAGQIGHGAGDFQAAVDAAA